MQSHAISFDSRDCIGRQDIHLSAAGATILRFWIPLVAVGIAVYAAQHSLHYATFSFIEGIDDVDLVADVGSSSQLRQISFIALGSLGALLLSMRSAMQVVVDRRLLFLLGSLCGWILLSGFWSVDPERSLKRTLLPLLSVVAVLGIAKHWQPRQVCAFTALITGFFVLLGVAAECLNGTFLSGEEYRFAGTLHPNDQAVNCAVLCLASLGMLGSSPLFEPRGRLWFWSIAFVLGMIFLLLTRSRTATGAFLAALFVFYYLGTSGNVRVFATGCVVMIATMMVILVAESERGHQNLFVDVLTMGRDQDSEDITSLTGRIPIWEQVTYDIAKRPLGGYGYGAFWTPQRVLTYSYIHDWEFSHAHSAYFETMLNVGAIGLVLGLLLLMSALWSAVQQYKTTEDRTYRFIVAIFALALVHGLADSNFVTVGFAPLVAILCISMVALHRGAGYGPQTCET
jgi:exopolysaccharide production protein ExoQ